MSSLHAGVISASREGILVALLRTPQSLHRLVVTLLPRLVQRLGPHQRGIRLYRRPEEPRGRSIDDGVRRPLAATRIDQEGPVVVDHHPAALAGLDLEAV